MQELAKKYWTSRTIGSFQQGAVVPKAMKAGCKSFPTIIPQNLIVAFYKLILQLGPPPPGLEPGEGAMGGQAGGRPGPQAAGHSRARRSEQREQTAEARMRLRRRGDAARQLDQQPSTDSSSAILPILLLGAAIFAFMN